MLGHYKQIVKKVGTVTHITNTDEFVADPCECGAESVYNGCEGDGSLHHHGRVHTVDDKLKALCRNCADKEASKWRDRRVSSEERSSK